MASGDTLVTLHPNNNNAPAWFYVAFTSGATEPAIGDTLWGDTSNANGVIEWYSLEGGAWDNTGTGYILLSNHNGTAWSSGENATANSTAAGDHLTLTALPVACAATLDVVRSDTMVLDFDATVNEVALFTCLMPRHYAGGGLTINVGVSSTTNTGDMSWALFLKSYTDDTDNLSNVGTDPSALKVFAAPNFNTAFDAASVAGEIAEETTTFTDGADMDSVAAGEYFHLLIMRDAQDSTNDDMAADAELVFIEIKET